MSEVAVEAPAVEQTPIETEVVQTESKSWFTEEGSWNREAFEDGLGEHTIFDKYKTPAELVKATINKDQLIGKKAEEWWNSDDADIAAKRAELMGVPKEASEYQFDLPEDSPLSEENLNAFKEYAKEVGLPKDMAAKLVEWDVGRATEALATQKKEEETFIAGEKAKLKDEWKNQYEYNQSKAFDALDHLGLSDYKDEGNPAFIKAVFDKIVPLISNDTIIEGRQTQSLASIQDNLNDIEEKIFTHENQGSAEYKALLQDRLELYKKLG